MPNPSLDSTGLPLDRIDDAAMIADDDLSLDSCALLEGNKEVDDEDDGNAKVAGDDSLLSCCELRLVRHRSRAADLDRLRKVIEKIHRESTKPLADVIRDRVLHHLPVSSIVRFSTVASSWHDVVSAPIFAHTQSYSHRSISGLFFGSSGGVSYAPFPPLAAHSLPDSSLSFLYPYAVEICSSSNGLLLCYARSSGTFIVCNPVTAAWTVIPGPPISPGNQPAAVLIFHPDVYNFRADYAVVIAFEIYSLKGCFGFQTFSSSAGGWSISNQICEAEHMYPTSGIASGGAAYWRTTMLTVVEYNPAGDTVRVVTWPMGYSEAKWEIGEMGGTGRLYCSAVTERAVQVYKLLPESDEWPRWVLVKSLDVKERWADDVEDGCTVPDDEFWEVDGCGEVVFNKRPWPLRFQSGEMEILLWGAGKVMGINLASRGVRTVADSGGFPEIAQGSNFVSHIGTLSALPTSPATESTSSAALGGAAIDRGRKENGKF